MCNNSKNEISYKPYLKRYILLLLLITVVISFLFYRFYYIVRHEFVDEIRQYAKHLAASIAVNIKIEDIEQIHDSKDASKEVYKKLQMYLQQYKNNIDDVLYIYIMRRSKKPGAKPSDMEYVVDLPSGDDNHNGKIDEDEKSESPGTPYDASSLPAMVRAWQIPDADEDISPDPPYPDLLSGYAPIQDAFGTTYAIVGIDISADTISNKLLSVKNSIIFYACFIIFLVSLILILLARFQMSNEKVKFINNELKRTMSLRDKFSRMIVHDLRNPLFFILGSSSMYKYSSDSSKEEIMEVFTQIENQALRMKYLMENMLFLAKSEHGELILNKEVHDIKNIINESVKNNKSYADLIKIKLLTELPSDSKNITVDKNLFMRVLDNLISNAIKFSNELDAVIIKLRYLENDENFKFEIKVCDNGPGIPDEKINEVFQIFKGHSEDSQDVSSFGLGLAFCKMVVDAHDGTIDVEQNTPKGSVFIIKL